MKFEAPRGTHDILPAEQPLWRRVIGEVERLCALYGYRPIQTPVFEDTELFPRTSGEGSDVVQKEMYTFTDRGDRSLTLRPEGTAPICRAYLEHGLHREPQPQKLYTIAPMYRYGAPGRGRYREHWQLSVEAIGSDDPALDAEVIQLYDTLLRRPRRHRVPARAELDRRPRPAGRPTSSGCAPGSTSTTTSSTRTRARRRARARCARSTTSPPSRRTCRSCCARRRRSATRSATPASSTSPPCARSSTRSASPTTLVPTLVRGLDYYTRTTWEFVGPLEGANSTISGGGRYDGLIEEIGGPPTPGIGFGAGIERLLLALEEAGVDRRSRPRSTSSSPSSRTAPRELALRWLNELRDARRRGDTDYAGRSLKGQLTQARPLRAPRRP